MTRATYELRKISESGWIFICRFCAGETRDRASIERLYCPHCHWFHEPLDEDSALKKLRQALAR